MTLDIARAKLTVKLARYAYHEENRAQTDVGLLGLREFRWFSDSSTQAFTTVDDRFAYLSFRGTESDSPIDWVADGRFAPATGVFGTEVHSGFKDALDEVWDDIVAVLHDTGLPAVVTGHSLGGALATLAAARLASSGTSVAAMHSYGSPRVGRRDFAGEFQKRLSGVSFRFINHIDIVTRVPLLIQSYRHVGSRVYFNSTGTPHLDASAWMIALEDVRFRFAHLGSIRAAGLNPHSIGEYARLVESL